MADDKKNPLGPVGDRVRANVERIREARNMSKRELSEATALLKRPIPPLGMSRLAAGTRRVDADDLVVLALALNVSPLTLLLPDSWSDDDVWLTERRRVQSRTAWLWGQGLTPAVDADPEADDQAAYKAAEEFRALALPAERRRAAEHPANREAQELAEMVTRLVQTAERDGDDPAKVKRSLRAARLRLRKLEAELEQIELTSEELGGLASELE
ncbi:hypothetical protein [Streptomyces sp. NPDC093260]|uniref:hypothetical protein n=1 Tax=Streptomyces sp. NPDC093260 TaxID=3155073 RepID=UPI003425C634